MAICRTAHMAATIQPPTTSPPPVGLVNLSAQREQAAYRCPQRQEQHLGFHFG